MEVGLNKKYIAPVITAPQIEIIPLFPGNAEEERILKLLAASFRLSSDEFGYEIKLRGSPNGNMAHAF